MDKQANGRKTAANRHPLVINPRPIHARKLQRPKTPCQATEPSLDHLDQRSTIILKGLQILEKIQKISNPTNQDAPRTLNVTHISNVLATPAAKDQDTQAIEG